VCSWVESCGRSGPFGDLPRSNYPEKRPWLTGQSTVTEIGAHGVRLEQAGKLNNVEITSGYWPAKESKTDGWGRVRKISPKRRPVLEVRAKDPEASQLRSTATAVTACGSPASTPPLVYCNSVNWPLNNSCNITLRPALIPSVAHLNVSLRTQVIRNIN
jgi:hypothetical protein